LIWIKLTLYISIIFSVIYYDHHQCLIPPLGVAAEGSKRVYPSERRCRPELGAMVSDTKVYKILDKDPTPRFKRKMIAILTRLKSESKITQSQYDHMYPTSDMIPRLYGSPKIHKQGTPLRPIVDYTGSMTYNLSRALADLLKPLVGKSEYYVKNTASFVKDLKDIRLKEDEIMNSHDVVSLFTNVPIKDALKAIEDKLKKDKTLKERTMLAPEDIMELMDFVLSTTYFSYGGKIYQQIQGAPMGSPVSVVVANMYMEAHEEEAMDTAPLTVRPKMWKRYVDDSFEIVNKHQRDNLTSHLNSIDPSRSIQFTDEPEKDDSIPFLDALITKKHDGSLKTTVYRKATHTDQYLSFNSHHPLEHKLGVIRTLYERNDNIVTEEIDRKKEEEHVDKALSVCGYPKWTFKEVRKRLNNKKDKTSEKKKEDHDNKVGARVTIPYVKGVSETLQRVFRRHGVATSLRPHKTIKQLLVHPKDKRDPRDTAGVVYKIPCKDCSKVYIGETARKFGVREKEHIKDGKELEGQKYTRAKKKESVTELHKSALTDHAAQCNHVIDWDGVKLPVKDPNYDSRGIREAIEIRKAGRTSMNRDSGRHLLSEGYTLLLPSAATPAVESSTDDGHSI